MKGAKSMARKPLQHARFRIGGIFHVTCRDKDGNIKWADIAKNLVFDAGLDHVLDVVFHGSTPVSPWYIGLVADNPTFAAGDILSSHAGWTEDTHYTGDRKAYVENAASSQSSDNAGNAASFAINDTTTLAGAFLCSAATGTSGTLFCGALFSQGDRAVSSGDTVNVTYTVTAADDGA
jgi:hypothetical protein